MSSLPIHLRPELSKEWTEFKIDLSACVQSCQNGVPLGSLKMDFAEHLCYELPVEKFGFQSVHDLVSAARDVVELAKDPGTHQLMVKACVTEKTAHIAAMIAAQRSVRARKRRGGRGRRRGGSRGHSASSWAPCGRGSFPYRGPPAGYGQLATSATLRPVSSREFPSSSRGQGATRGSQNIRGCGYVAGSAAAAVRSQTHQPGNQRNQSDVRLAPCAEPARTNSFSSQTKGAAIPTGGNDASEKQQSQTASPSSIYIAFGRGRGRGIGLVEPQLPLGVGVTAPPALSPPASVQSIGETSRTSTPSAPVELSRMDSWLRSSSSPSPSAPIEPQQSATGLPNVGSYSRGFPTPNRVLSGSSVKVWDPVSYCAFRGIVDVAAMDRTEVEVHYAKDGETSAAERRGVPKIDTEERKGPETAAMNFSAMDLDPRLVAAVDVAPYVPYQEERSNNADERNLPETEPLWVARIKTILKKPHQKTYAEELFLKNYGQQLPLDWFKKLDPSEYILMTVNGLEFVYKRTVSHA